MPTGRVALCAAVRSASGGGRICRALPLPLLPPPQVLEMLVKDSHLTGRTEVGRASIRLEDLIKAQQGAVSSSAGQGGRGRGAGCGRGPSGSAPGGRRTMAGEGGDAGLPVGWQAAGSCSVRRGAS